MKRKTTIREFIERLFDESRYGVDLMTVDDARTDLETFRQEGWDLPEGITAEEYSKIWNELVKSNRDKEEEQMNTITIYANYGVLAAEKRTVYSEKPISEAFDQLTVRIPDGWNLYETVTGSKALTAPWGENYSINEILAGDKYPMFIVIDNDYKERRIRLETC